MFRVDAVSFVRLRPNHMQAKLSREIVILDRIFTMRHRVDGSRDVPAFGNQYHSVAFPTESAASDLFQDRGIGNCSWFHVHMVGATLTLDA